MDGCSGDWDNAGLVPVFAPGEVQVVTQSQSHGRGTNGETTWTGLVLLASTCLQIGMQISGKPTFGLLAIHSFLHTRLNLDRNQVSNLP